MMWKASGRKLKELLQRRKRKQNSETGAVDGANSHVSVCSSSCWSDADDSLISFGDLDFPDTNSTCDSICSVNELEHEHELELEHEHGNSAQSISVELVAQVSRLEDLLSNQNKELNNSSSRNNSHSNNDHDNHSYYGSEDEDDSLANELEQLTESEEALRNELEQYQSYSVVSMSMQEDHTGSDDTTESDFLNEEHVESNCSEQPISYLPSFPFQKERSSPCPGKQVPFQRKGYAAARTVTATTSQDSVADGHDESCGSENSDSDSMLYGYRLLQEEDLATIPEQTSLDLSSATQQRVAVKGGWEWETSDDSITSDVDVDVDVEIDGDGDGDNDSDSADNNDSDYLDDSYLSDQQVDESEQAESLQNDESEQAESLQNGGSAAFAQEAVPAKRVALLGGGEWEMMRKEDLFLLLTDDSDSSSDPLDDNKESEQDAALSLPVTAKRVAVLGGGEWEMRRDGDLFLNDDSDSSSDRLDNETFTSIGCMNITTLAQPLPAKRAAVLGGGQWKESLEDDLTDDYDWSSSSDLLNEEAESEAGGVVETILPLAEAKGSSDDVAAIIKTEHHQRGHSRIVCYFVIAFITFTMLSKVYGSIFEVTYNSKARPQDESDKFRCS